MARPMSEGRGDPQGGFGSRHLQAVRVEVGY